MTIVLNDVVSPNNTSVINTNFQKIEDTINDDLLKREIGIGEANEMRTHLDMNSNKVTNLSIGVDSTDAATFGQLTNTEVITAELVVEAEDAADSSEISANTAAIEANTAAIEANTAGVAANAAEASEIAALAAEAAAEAAEATATASAAAALASETAADLAAVEATTQAGNSQGHANNSKNSADDAEAAAASLTKIEFATFIQGPPADAEKLTTIVVSTEFTLSAGLVGSQAYAEVVPTAAATFNISKNEGASLGTVNFALGAAVATFTFITPTAFVAGDRLQIVNQTTADATLADISLTIRGDL